MINPRVEINLKKLEENVRLINSVCRKNKIEIAAVTKGFCALPEIASIFVGNGCRYLADSRIQNLKNLTSFDIEKIMLRLPMISEAEEVVKYSDISLNSEITTIEALNEAAIKLNKRHGVIFMVDLGDLREGYIDERNFFDAVEKTKTFKNIDIKGLGANLTCFGGVIPDEKNLSRLVYLSEKLEKDHGIKSEIISGGNSSSLHLIKKGLMVEGINNLRLGEAFLLGRETAFGEPLKGTHSDVFQLVTEIVELKVKPTIPVGMIGVNAFGEKPVFEDRGNRKVAICAIGKQDVDISKLSPIDDEIMILGASSDHMILDVHDSLVDYKVGSIVRFDISYGGILSTMTSPYVDKVFIR